MSPRRVSHFHEHLVHEKHKQGTTFAGVYHVGDTVLGEGMTSCVKICTKVATGQRYALKTLQINRMDPAKMKELRDEITIMKGLDHPHIVRLYDVFEEKSKMYLIMEFCQGGELFDRLFQQEGGKFTEKKAAQLVEKMLESIHFMHGKNICHRDLKLENFIFEDASPDSDLKLIDFGLSHRYTKNENMRNILGTSYYMAPEVLKQDYNSKCDLWSIGVITYVERGNTRVVIGGCASGHGRVFCRGLHHVEGAGCSWWFLPYANPPSLLNPLPPPWLW